MYYVHTNLILLAFPHSFQSAEVMARLGSTGESPLKLSHVYSSLERAIHSDRVSSPILVSLTVSSSSS